MSKRRWIPRAVVVFDALFWLSFWGYFFVQSIATPKIIVWGDTPPFFSIGGRSFPGDVAAISQSLVFQIAFWLNLPCWIITWPLGYLVGAHTVFGTNAAGARLVLITMLSFVQWWVIGKAILLIVQRFQLFENRLSR